MADSGRGATAPSRRVFTFGVLASVALLEAPAANSYMDGYDYLSQVYTEMKMFAGYDPGSESYTVLAWWDMDIKTGKLRLQNKKVPVIFSEQVALNL